MKRSPRRGEGELPAARRRCWPSTPSASLASAAASARHNGIRMGSMTSYTLLKKVGGGAFGVVHMARHRCSGMVVAIKSARSGGDELLREASLLTECRGNPAVVNLLEVACGPNTEDVHLVMEFVGPKDLHYVLCERRRHGHPFTEAETRCMMRELLDGVERMHARGIVHCDLKPGNVLVGKCDGRLKICDFGLSMSVSVPPLAGTEIQGTPRYMAPELLLGGNDPVAAIDMWSLGCVMAEIMAGEPLFHEGKNALELGMKIIRFLGIPDDVSGISLGVTTPSKLRDTVPEERLSKAGFDVLHGLLEYNPKDRLTAVAALQMPWFAPESNDSPSPSSTAVD